ncbi:MAG: class I SAM-dependent rRNA methyltransferase [candidate division Zixibacteria bacterium]|nr:class I SAM-dependent rRNA methyltransferase [candidate division Zixibacteria bacterium]
MNNIILKKGREKSVANYHPWLFSGAIGKAEGKPQPGEIVRVCDREKRFLAYGYYNSKPQIQVRLLDWTENAEIDEAWWHNKIAYSIARRRSLADDDTTDSYRLIFSESDGLPGLIVDRYADFLVLQSLTAGIVRVKQTIVEALTEQLKPSGIYERSDADIRKIEGLASSTGVLCGDKPPLPLVIAENGLKFYADITGGQKTGFYLDQRMNRLKTTGYASGLHILDCFCHTGAFSVYALRSKAKSVTMVDSSADCLELAGRNIELNNLEIGKTDLVKADVFDILRQYRDTNRRFNMIILDPPKFAKSKSQLKKALAGYKDINMLAMSILKPGGLLATFSCSGAVDNETLKTVLFWAAVDTDKQVQIIDDFHQGPDHPRLATFPEADYLGGFLCRIE